MELFIVIKKGIYRHEICGIYDTEPSAINRAKVLAENDKDSYHDYLVCQCDLNQDTEDVDGKHSFEKGKQLY